MTDAVFKLSEKDALECKVLVETELLSPFDLAASWKAQHENLQPSRVRGTYDVVMDVTESRPKVCISFD
jgi:6-phosphofructo-2-kinase/fructose-2,6-biphosphatase